MSLKFTENILKVTCISLFLGRAWQHLFWDAPFRTLFWDESWMSTWVHLIMDISWQEYAGSNAVDTTLQVMIRLFGMLYLLCAVAVFFFNDKREWLGKLLIVGTTGLVFLSFLYWKEKFFQPAQLLEYTAQIGTPVLLYGYILNKWNEKQFVLLVKGAVAITFIAHGFYAIGYYPQPGYFVDMTINVFGLSEAAARNFLKVIGMLDILIAIGIFIPNRKIQVTCIYYALIWGGMTALARLIGNFYFDFFWESIHQNLFQVLVRIPHAGLPLVLLMCFQTRLGRVGALIS